MSFAYGALTYVKNGSHSTLGKEETETTLKCLLYLQQFKR